MDFPSNSHNVTGQPGQPEQPKKEVNKVIVGEVIQRKPPLGKKIKSIFFNGDFKAAALYVLTDVILPGIRDTMYDTATKGVGRVIYGDRAVRRNNLMIDPRRDSIFSYNRVPQTQSFRSTTMLPDQPPHVLAASRGGRKSIFNEIILGSREEAELVLERLTDIIDTYQSATVGDLYDLLGLPMSPIDNKWGWVRLGADATVKQIREGYLLDLPYPEPLS